MLLDLIGQHVADAFASASSSDPFASLHHHSHDHATAFLSTSIHKHVHITAFPSTAQAACMSPNPPLSPEICAFFKNEGAPQNTGSAGMAPTDPKLALGHQLTWIKCNPVAVGHQIGNEGGRSIIQCPYMDQTHNQRAS